VLPLLDTRVTFPVGDVEADGEVLAVVELAESDGGGGVGVITDVSPFHPVDHGWPDQGPDRGMLIVGGVPVDVRNVVLGATQGTNVLCGAKIPVRRGEPGWAFWVVHVLAVGSPVPAVGERVQLRVDPAYRAALSMGHTGCHIAALALNAALADRWRKPVALDGLGHPNFDQHALAASIIRPYGSTDRYRLGKSLRKKGFDSAELPIDTVQSEANAVLERWVAAGAAIRIECDGPGLTDRRTWVCDLPDGQERIACGGTHPASLAGAAAIEVQLRLDDAELTMETEVTLC
jgi:alanyl-tRNA synthetase